MNWQEWVVGLLIVLCVARILYGIYLFFVIHIHSPEPPGKIRTEKRESTIAVPVSPVFLKITVPELHPLPGRA